jgi:hypothetical protein
MTSASLKAKIVRVKVEKGRAGLYYATSPDLKGLLVGEPTLEALDKAIPGAVADLYAACGVHVVVTKAEAGGGDGDYSPWIALPAEVARAALANAGR